MTPKRFLLLGLAAIIAGGFVVAVLIVHEARAFRVFKAEMRAIAQQVPYSLSLPSCPEAADNWAIVEFPKEPTGIDVFWNPKGVRVEYSSQGRWLEYDSQKPMRVADAMRVCSIGSPRRFDLVWKWNGRDLRELYKE